MEEKDTIVDRLMKQGYLKALNRYLNFRWITLGVMVGLLVFTFALIPGLGGEFMPPLEEGNLWIRALLPRTVSLEAAERMAPRLREVIASIPEVKNVMSHVGRPDDGTDVTSFFNLEFNVPLKPMEKWRKGMTRQKIEDELTKKFNEFPGVTFSFSQLIRDNVEEALSGVKGANSVKLFGSDLQTLEETGQRVVNVLRSVRGIENVGLFHILGQPNLEIKIDRPGLLPLRDQRGRRGDRRPGGHRRQGVLADGRRGEALRHHPPPAGRAPRRPDRHQPDPGRHPGADGKVGARIPLGQLAKINPHVPGASYIYRENNQRYIPIKFSVRDRDLASAIQEAQAKVEDPKDEAKLPAGYRVEWSGEFAQMQAANGRLMWIVPLSIGLIMGLLYTAFNSFKDALLVMVNVVAATMGGIWALRLTHTPFSISAAVGFISIFGVAVQNGVLLISYFNQLRAAGLPVRESVLRGAELRVRPMVITSLTAALGLAPAAFATSIGSQAQKPLAIVVVGGCSSPWR